MSAIGLPMQRVCVVVRGISVRVARAGSGSSVLLVHGGWGGADMHWSRVWERLATRYDVIAPDLPGLGALHERPLGSVAAYAQWLAELLDALSLERVICVGNSFGASVVWSFAGRFPARCAGLVLVDGYPMPKTPLPLAWLSRAPGARRLARALVHRLVYTESNLARAFADVGNVPAELRRAMLEEWPLVVPPYVDILVAGDGGPTPNVTPLLVWGARDRLPGSNLRDAARWRDRLPGASLRVIEGAGHFPQVEAPEAFVEVFESFVRGAEHRKASASSATQARPTSE